MSISLSENDYIFYFTENITDPLVLINKKLRSEFEYDDDIYAEKTALKYFEKISECFYGNIYLLAASDDAAPPNKLRSKKGVLWQEKKLCELDYRNGEINVGENYTRLVSLVNLAGFCYDASELRILNWMSSLIILTTITDIDVLNGYVGDWLAKGYNSAFAFDYDAVAKDLLRLSTTSVLRYFPADNGRNETLIAVGNREFIEDSVGKCLQSIGKM